MLLIDAQEKNQEVFRSFDRYAEYEIANLESGDFVMGEYALEHKSPSDYLESLHSGHLFEQIDKMRMNFKKFAVVVDGNPSDVMRNNSTIASVASCCVRDCPVIFCGNTNMMAKMSVDILTKWNDGKDRIVNPSLNQKYSKDPQINVVTGLPNISEKIGTDLLIHFGSIVEIANATVDQLQEVDKIGPVKAQEIYRVFHTPRW